jgi:hypothetical protein
LSPSVIKFIFSTKLVLIETIQRAVAVGTFIMVMESHGVILINTRLVEWPAVDLGESGDFIMVEIVQV